MRCYALLIIYAFYVIGTFGARIGKDDNTNCPKIKTKLNWGGKPSKNIDFQTFPVKNVIIHHTVSQKCDTYRTCASYVLNIQSYHMRERGFGDIGYNFLVGNDGNIYEGVGWHKVGSHTRSYNTKSIGIAFIGNFSDELPTQKALNAAKKLLECGLELGELDKRYKLLGGRQVISTDSPGLELYNEIQTWAHWSNNP